MSKLYNEILNEVYLIQGFDSWDNTEQTFKGDIENSVGRFFIYEIKSHPKPYGILQLFDNGVNNGWQEFKKYRLKVRYNGILIQLDRDAQINCEDLGFTHVTDFPNSFKFTIDDIDNVTDCGCMFYWCGDLISVPKFDTSKVTDMINMFYECKNLISVPKLNLKNANNVANMFGGCISLNEETKKIWRLDEGGTPKRYNT